MHIMPTTEVIGVVNSLDKDQILDFLKHFFFSETFPFPMEYIVQLFLSGEMTIKYSWLVYNKLLIGW